MAEPLSQVLVAGPLDLAGGHRAHAVGVEQQQRHHPRVKSLIPTGILELSGARDLGEIQFIRQIQQKIDLMVF